MDNTTTELEQAERYVPPHTRDNYEGRVADGSATWPDLARQFAVDGQTRLAQWAGLKADEAGAEGRTLPPRRRGRPPRETT